jgi:NAD(P)-dependent dehydrogenase (short-subunit alcohol dehydrogenase family)
MLAEGQERFTMDLQLQGKTAIVTGGSAGIGLAIARLLAPSLRRIGINRDGNPVLARPSG